MNEHQLQFTAFQYVSGELSESEAERFEARMAEDELACLAVAQVVQVSQALRTGLTPRESADCKPAACGSAKLANSRSRTRLVIGFAAACLVAVCVVAFRSEPAAPGLGGNVQVSQNANSTAPRTASLIHRYVETHESALDVDIEEVILPIDEDESANDIEIDVPSWMLAAVEIDSDGKDSSSN